MLTNPKIIFTAGPTSESKICFDLVWILLQLWPDWTRTSPWFRHFPTLLAGSGWWFPPAHDRLWDPSGGQCESKDAPTIWCQIGRQKAEPTWVEHSEARCKPAGHYGIIMNYLSESMPEEARRLWRSTTKQWGAHCTDNGWCTITGDQQHLPWELRHGELKDIVVKCWKGHMSSDIFSLHGMCVCV